jgi:hypothetical protein
MDLNSPDLPNKYFRKNLRKDQSNLTMDADMIRLLLAIDENKTMAQVAKEVNMNLSTLRANLAKLLKLRLIEPLEKEVAYMDAAFMETLRQNLTQAIGPMGEILIEDVAEDMGLDPARIPAQQAAQLVNQIAQEIPDEDSRGQFEKIMLQWIPKATL